MLMKKVWSIFLVFLLLCTTAVFAAQETTIKYSMLSTNYEGSDSSFFYSFADGISGSRFSLKSLPYASFQESGAGRCGGVVSVRQ